MPQTTRDFWLAFLETFEKGKLDAAFEAGWQDMLAANAPELPGVLRHIAAHLGVTPRQLRKMAPRRRARWLLPKLPDIRLLMEYVTDAYYLRRRGRSVSRFLDLLGKPHDERNVVAKNISLPAADDVFAAVERCMVEARSVRAIYRYLALQSALVMDWQHRARGAIAHIEACHPNLATSFDDDYSVPVEPSEAEQRQQTIADLEAALATAIAADQYGTGVVDTATRLLAEAPSHAEAACALGRCRAGNQKTCEVAGAATTCIARDWLLMAYLVETQAGAPAVVFDARAQAHRKHLLDIAGRGEAPAGWAADQLLAPLWRAGHGDVVVRLVQTVFSALGQSNRRAVLDWVDDGSSTDPIIHRGLLDALVVHVETVKGAPIGELGLAAGRRLARRLNREGHYAVAARRYRVLQRYDKSDSLRLETVLNDLEADAVDTVVGMILAGDASSWRARLAGVEKPLCRLARIDDPALAGPAAYLLAVYGWLAMNRARPPRRVAARLAEALRHSAGGSSTSLWAAHACYLHRLAAFQRRRCGGPGLPPLDCHRLGPLVGRLSGTHWRALFRAADRADTAHATVLAQWLIEQSVDLPIRPGLHRVYLEHSPAIREHWTRRATACDIKPAQAVLVECRLVEAHQATDEIEAARAALDRLERWAERPAPAATIAAWLDAGAELRPAWSRRSILWFRLRLARYCHDRASLPAILTRLFYTIRDTDRFGAGELIALARDWELADVADRLAAALPPDTAEQNTDDAPVASAAPVSIVFVGGNEVQARRDDAARDRLLAEDPGITATFHHVGWDAHWARRLPQLLATCNDADAVVLMPYIRTHFGRAVRAGLERPWIACPGTGTDAMVRSIRHAGRVARRRHGNAG